MQDRKMTDQNSGPGRTTGPGRKSVGGGGTAAFDRKIKKGSGFI